MRTYLTTLLSLGAMGLAMVIGCAQGQGTDPSPTMAADPTEPGGEKDSSIKLPVPSQKDDAFEVVDGGTEKPRDGGREGGGGTSSGGTSSGGTSSGSTGGLNSSSGGASSGGTSGNTSSGGAQACTTPPSCSAWGFPATNLGSIDGDSAAMVKTARGHQSTWLYVYVNEGSSDDIDPHARFTLTSPPGSNYDLFITTDSCRLIGKSENPAETPDVLGVTGRDSTIFNDGFYAVIEVRHVSGPCDSTTPWTLTIEGNK